MARAVIGDEDPTTRATDRWAHFLSSAGFLEAERRNEPRAIDLYEAALAIYRKTGHQVGQSVILSNLAAVNMDLGRLDAAEGYVTDALAVAKEIDEPRRLCLRVPQRLGDRRSAR